MKLEDLTWQEVKDKLKHNQSLLIPVGVKYNIKMYMAIK